MEALAIEDLQAAANQARKGGNPFLAVNSRSLE